MLATLSFLTHHQILWVLKVYLMPTALFCLLTGINTSYASVLSDAANALSPGQSIRIKTSNLTAAVYHSTGTSYISWSNTGSWCPVRNKVIHIGNTHGPYPHRRIEYDEASNSWSNTESLHSSLTGTTIGHGYDGTAVDPEQGDIYFRPFNDKTVFKWTRSTDTWSTLSDITGGVDVAEVIEWWPGRGLVYSDIFGVRIFDGSSWSEVVGESAVSDIGYSSIGEYQPNADLYIFGGGNRGSTQLYRLASDDTLTDLGADAPIGFGTNTSQGILVHDPASHYMIAWDRSKSWYQFDPIEDTWSPLNVCSGDGTSPANGTPNLSGTQSIAVPIAPYGLIMFLKHDSNDVWLYKHAQGPGNGNTPKVVQYAKITSKASGPAIPFTAGLAFKKGDVVDTPTLDLTDYQVEVKKRWNDNSVKHVIVSGHADLTAGSPRTIAVYDTGSTPSNSPLTATDILSANPLASIQCGSIGTVTLSSLLGSPVRTWISGPEMVETHYQSGVGSDATLVAKFHVRLYKNSAIWIRAIVENGALDVTTETKNYVPAVAIGGTQVYNNGGVAITHNAHTRWAVEGWIGITDPGTTIDLDTSYLMQSGLVPHYWKTNPSTDTLNGLHQTYTPMQNGGWTQHMGGTGFQHQIGLLPLWDALYINSEGDHRAYNAVISNAKCLNSYPIVWSDSSTDAPIVLSDWGSWTVGGAAGGGATTLSAGSLTWDIAHHGSGGFLAYLITGDYYHLETMQYQAALCYLFTSSARGSGTSRIIMPVQTRGIAWSMRTVGQAASIAPSDPVSDDLTAWLSDGGIDYWNLKRQEPGQNELGYLYAYNFGAYETGKLAPWQQHFWIQTMGYLSDLEPLSDMTRLNAVRDHMYKAIVGILGPNGTENYCFTQASTYNLKVSDTNDSPEYWYDSWGAVFEQTKGYPNTSCGNTLQGGSGGDPINALTGYWGNLLPAIAYAVDHNAIGASDAWARLTGASNWSTVENSGFEDIPIWGIVPRKSNPAHSDTIVPTITTFDIASTSDSFLVRVKSFVATDNVEVTGYYIGESTTQPQAKDTGWLAVPPTGFQASSDGSVTLFAWVKDGAGNISARASDIVEIALAPPLEDTLTVGPGRTYATLFEAIAAAEDGNLIEIDAGTYAGDVAIIDQDNLTIRGVGGRAHLDAAGNHAEGKGTLVIKGNDVTIENIEFSGAAVPDQNGAGIRAEGRNLTIRNCSFHHNENGILGGAGDVLIEYSEFFNNGFGDGYTHNMYISNCNSFTLRFSYSHHAVIGHNVKSRAQENHILYNRIMDGSDGTASRAIDLPNGGRTFIIGNCIQQGPNTDNANIIGYGAEGLTNSVNELFVSGNTIVNDRFSATFFEVNNDTTTGIIVNNLLVGEGTLLSGSASVSLANNWHTQSPGFVDKTYYDYRLTAESEAVDAAIDPGSANSISLVPVNHYVYDLQKADRPDDGALDIGAFEYTDASALGDSNFDEELNTGNSYSSGSSGCFILNLLSFEHPY